MAIKFTAEFSDELAPVEFYGPKGSELEGHELSAQEAMAICAIDIARSLRSIVAEQRDLVTLLQEGGPFRVSGLRND